MGDFRRPLGPYLLGPGQRAAFVPEVREPEWAIISTLRPSTLLRASCLTTSATSAPRHDSGEIDQGIIDTLAAVKRLVEVGPAPGPVWAVSERWREEASGARPMGTPHRPSLPAGRPSSSAIGCGDQPPVMVVILNKRSLWGSRLNRSIALTTRCSRTASTPTGNEGSEMSAAAV